MKLLVINVSWVINIKTQGIKYQNKKIKGLEWQIKGLFSYVLWN